MAQEGMDLSMHRLADATGVGIGTAYRHFPSYDDLLVALYREYVEIFDDATATIPQVEDPYERIIRYLDVVIEFSLDHPVARNVTRLVHRRQPEAVDTREGQPPSLAEAVNGAREAGKIRDDLTATDVALIASFFTDLIAAGYHRTPLYVARMRALMIDAIQPEGGERTRLPLEVPSPR